MGRERELRELEVGLEGAISGRGRLFLVVGEPGIGKTRLASEVATAASRRGAEVRWGRCWEGGGAPAYWPWVQIIRSHARACSKEDLVRQMETGASLIAEIAPEVRDILPDLPPAMHPSDTEEARFRLFDAAVVFLRNASTSRPLFLVLDDLQWADEPSLLLLDLMARNLAESSILVLGTYRDVEAKLVEPVAKRLSRLASEAQQIHLRGLDVSDVGLWIEKTSGREGSEGMVGAVHDATGGNPLFVAELIRLLAAEGKLVDAEERASLPIPDRVREVVRRHVALVSEGCRRLLSVAAAVGRDFDTLTLERICPDQRIVDSTSEARAAGLLVERTEWPGHFSFAHDLVRETLYEDVPYGERLELHRTIGVALETLHSEHLEPHWAELARHFFLAAAGGTAELAVEYSTRAGERAARQLAYEQAVVHYEHALRALSLVDSPDVEPRRLRLWLALGDTRWWAGRLEDSKAAFWNAAQSAETLGATRELAVAAFGFGGRGAYPIGGANERVIALLEKALGGLRDRDSALRAMLMGLTAVTLAYTPERERGLALARDAVEMARRVGDKQALQYVLNTTLHATWSPDNLEERLEASAEVVRLGKELGGTALVSGGWRAVYLLEAGDIGAAKRATMRRSVHALRCRFCRTWSGFGLARTALFEGRFDEAEGIAAKTLELAREVQLGDGEPLVMLLFLLLRREQGQLPEMVDPIRARAQRNHALPFWTVALAWTYAELGREGDTRRELEPLAIGDFSGVPRDMFWLVAMTFLSDVVSFTADTARAEPIYSLLLPFFDRCAATVGACLGSVSRSLGALATTLSRFDEAALHFERALEANSRWGSRPWVAHTQHGYARMLLARGAAGDRDQARALLERAGTSARELGMRCLAERVRALDTPGVATRPPELVKGCLRRDGRAWRVEFRGEVSRVRDSRGLRYLAVLLARPGEDVHVLRLVAAADGEPDVDRRGPLEPDLVVERSPDPESLVDTRARAAYRRRLAELRQVVEEARAAGDVNAASSAEAEMEALVAELTRAVGLGGRARRTGSLAERARVSVTKALKAAVRKLADADPSLGHHLETCVRTGTYCSYRPDPERLVSWNL